MYHATPGRDAEPGLLARWNAGMLKIGDTMKTSLPCDNRADEDEILRIFEAEFDRPSVWAGKVFAISDYICGVVSLSATEEGESVLGVRTLLLGPRQRPIRFTSKDVLDFMRKVSKRIGFQPPWEPPVKAKLTVSKRGGVPKYGFKWVNEQEILQSLCRR